MIDEDFATGCPCCGCFICECVEPFDDDGRDDFDECPTCGDHGACGCNDDPEDGDELLTGRCAECDTWGDYQCSRHGDVVVEAMRAEHEEHATQEALQTLAAMPGARCGAAWEDLQRAVRRVLGEQTADAAAVLDGDAAQLGAIVAEFSGWMLAEFAANAVKGPPRSWRTESRAWAFNEIERHVAKLYRAVVADTPADIREHAADVANCALMLADVCGLVTTPDPRDAGPREGDAAHYGGGSE